MIRLIIGAILIGLFGFCILANAKHHSLNENILACILFFLIPGILLIFFGFRNTVWGTVRQLRSPDPKRRSRAMQKLVATKNAVPLIRLLQGHETSEVKDAAVQALRKIGRPALEPIIHAALWKEIDIRDATAILGGHETSTAMNLLKESLQMQNTSIEETARILMFEIARAGIHSSKKDDVEASVAWLIGIKDTRACEALVSVVQDRGASEEWRKEVRIDAARALGELGDAQVIEPLLRIHGRQDAPDDTIDESLVKFGRQIAAPVLKNMFEADLRLWHAIRLLKRVDALQEAMKVSVEALTSKSPKVRRMALDLLRELDDRAAIPHLIRLLADDDYETRGTTKQLLDKLDPGWPKSMEARSALATFIEQFPRTEGIEKVLELIDPDWANSSQAAALLDRLIHDLSSSGTEARKTSIRALERIRNNRAVAPLTELLGDPEVGEDAARALGTIGSTEAVEQLVAALENKDTRLAAASALRKIGGPKATAAVDRYKMEVVNALAESFWRDGGPILRLQKSDDPFWHWSELGELSYYKKLGSPEAAAHVGKILQLAEKELLSESFEYRWSEKLAAAASIMRLAGDSSAIPVLQRALKALEKQWKENEKRRKEMHQQLRTIAEAEHDPLLKMEKTMTAGRALEFGGDYSARRRPFELAESAIKSALEEIKKR